MIWIATLCLFAIAAWLIFNGINERRWVQAHSHDETVAADEGFLPNFSSIAAKRRIDGDTKLSIKDENTRFARAVAKVQEKTAKAGEKIEARAQRARVDDAHRPASVAEENDFFGRAVGKVQSMTDKVGSRLDERMRRERQKGDDASGRRSIAEEDGLFGRTVAKVTEKTDAIGQRMAEKAKRSGSAERTSLAEEDSVFARMVNKVSGRLERVESRIDARVGQARQDPSEDFITRTSRKVGDKVLAMDDRVISRSREVQARMERGKSGGTGTGDDDGGTGTQGSTGA